jgi:chemotaxis protein CheD
VTLSGALRSAAAIANLPPALPQFSHIRRSWDAQLGACVAKLLPGEYYVTRHDELIFTTLGSCISACVRDVKLGVGGMNHFMLPLSSDTNPGSWGDDQVSSATRYGNVAMERLINDILKIGGQRSNLEFKLMGGAKVLDMALDVGAGNVNFIRQFLKIEGFRIAAEDLGDVFARKVYYSPASGKVRAKRLTANVNRAVFERERDNAPTQTQIESGTVELF